MKYIVILLSILAFITCSKKTTDPNPGTQNTTDTTSTSINKVCENPTAIDMSNAQNFGDGTAASCTQAALQSLLDNGGKIVCNCGTEAFTLKLTSTLKIGNKEVIIDGKKLLTIDGNSSVRIFDKIGAANQSAGTLFALQNINLRHGKAILNANERGGAAFLGRAFGSLFLLNVTIENNESPLSASDDCGAIHTIQYKSVVVANTIFKNNKGANGGAIGSIGSGMEFYNCTFENNEATGTGGTFSKGGSGGAIYVDGTDQSGVAENNKIVLCGCVFKNNNAGYQAGAVNIVFYATKQSKTSIDKCSFESNTCKIDKGGAVYHMNGALSLSNSTFLSNTSPSQGGGLWTYNTNATIQNCTWNKNKAEEGANGLGGAFTLGGGDVTSATIVNCTFAENKAGNFASAIFNGGSITLINNLFYNNGIGNNPYAGAVINKETKLTVADGNLQFPKTFTGQYGQGNDAWITSNVMTVDPKLSSITDNGGPTKTMALMPESPAINKGTSTGAPTTDQRGKPRKDNVDIGAFEVQ